MADLLFVLIICAFFVATAAFVRACERIIGTAEDPETPHPTPVIEVVETEPTSHAVGSMR